MCRKCENRCNCDRNRCDIGRCRCNFYENRCDDFVWPFMFWMIRDMTRHCRCNFVDRYDRFRC